MRPYCQTRVYLLKVPTTELENTITNTIMMIIEQIPPVKVRYSGYYRYRKYSVVQKRSVLVLLTLVWTKVSFKLLFDLLKYDK